jgi:hypothetical protein
MAAAPMVAPMIAPRTTCKREPLAASAGSDGRRTVSAAGEARRSTTDGEAMGTAATGASCCAATADGSIAISTSPQEAIGMNVMVRQWFTATVHVNPGLSPVGSRTAEHPARLRSPVRR